MYVKPLCVATSSTSYLIMQSHYACPCEVLLNCGAYVAVHAEVMGCEGL